LIMAFIREDGNVIDYEIPITGKLNNPKFHWRNVIIDLIENIFIKPVRIGYIIHVKNTETEIEKSLTLSWAMKNSTLLFRQEKFIKKMTEFLADNPDVHITISPQHYAIKEKEYLLFYEAKKKYFLLVNNKKATSYTRDDSIKVDKMSVKDSFFVQYLNKQKTQSTLFTIQDKCALIIDSAFLNLKFNQLKKERENSLTSFFKDKGVLKQVKFTPDKNIIPYNGFSFYKIDYKGEFPESLIRAYREMNELNEEPPRDKFNKERKKINNVY
jgi:hypothetical protein